MDLFSATKIQLVTPLVAFHADSARNAFCVWWPGSAQTRKEQGGKGAVRSKTQKTAKDGKSRRKTTKDGERWRKTVNYVVDLQQLLIIRN